jgi:hypothetical protein
MTAVLAKKITQNLRPDYQGYTYTDYVDHGYITIGYLDIKYYVYHRQLQLKLLHCHLYPLNFHYDCEREEKTAKGDTVTALGVDHQRCS